MSAETWHPTWCSQVEDNMNGSEHWHFSHAEVLERGEGRATTPDSGGGFRAEVSWCLNYESGPQFFDEWDTYCVLSIESGAFEEKVSLSVGTNKLRDLAKFLFTEADRLDGWIEKNHRPLVRDHDEVEARVRAETGEPT